MAKKGHKHDGGKGSREPEQIEDLKAGVDVGASEPEAITRLPAWLACLNAAQVPKPELASMTAVATCRTLGRRRNSPRCPQ